MKRVLLFIASLSGGGAERVMSQIANGLAESGIEVHLSTWSGAQSPDFYPLDPRVTRHELGSLSPSSGRLLRLTRGLSVVMSMRHQIKALRPDAVLSFIDRTNIMAAIAAVGLNTRLVVSERVDPQANDTLPMGWRLVRPWAYRLCNLLVVQTTRVADWVANEWRIQASVVPNVLRAMPLPSQERMPLIVSVGRLVSQKGFDLSIEAFARLAPRYPSWRYVILGDGPLRPSLEALGQRFGLSEQLEFKGVVSDVDFWLERASICMQPSRFEGFPNAVMEAMAMGTATISSDCPSGPRDLITDAVDGLLVPVDSVDALESALERLLGDEALRRTIGHSAMSVRERFDRARVLRLWIDALRG